MTEVDIAIVGSGFAGIAMSVALAREGIDHVLLERADGTGGTWRDNQYPGCRCDVPSHLYSFSFALNPEWSETYSPQPEIWDYLRRVADCEGVTARTRFGAELKEARWDEANQRWELETTAGRWTAGVLVSGNGGLSEPSVPDIPGLRHFGGQVVHSAKWRPDVRLEGLRVAVIGTGASAIQIVPEIQPKVRSLHLFQRTPAWVLPHTVRRISDFEHALYRRVPGAQRLARWGIYWTRELLVLGMAKRPKLLRALRRLAERHLEQQVRDPELRARLTPSFDPGCKRLMLSNDYYPALQEPNAELVTDRIEEVTATGIRTADGRLRELDAIILATGFKVTDNPFAERVRGRHGRTLAEVWAESGQQAYRGTAVAGFPNLFLLMGPNTGLGHTSVVFMIEAQVRYVTDALRRLRERRASAVEVRPEVQSEYNRHLQQQLAGTVWNRGGCASWYLDRSGRNTTLWPDFTWKYWLLMRRFDAGSYVFNSPSGRAELEHPVVVGAG